MSEAIIGNPEDPAPPRPHAAPPGRRCADEDHAWSLLYATIGQPSTAEEVVKHLDADLPSKRDHLALYIRARTTLRAHKAAEARRQRIGAFVRRALAAMTLLPLQRLRAALAYGAHMAVEALPPIRHQPQPREPAAARAAALRADPDFAQASGRFDAGADGAATAVPGQAAGDDSRHAKAA